MSIYRCVECDTQKDRDFNGCNESERVEFGLVCDDCQFVLDEIEEQLHESEQTVDSMIENYEIYRLTIANSEEVE